MPYWEVISGCLGFFGIAAVVVLLFVIAHFQRKNRKQRRRKFGSARYAEIARQTGWRLSAQEPPEMTGLTNIVHKTVAILDAAELSTSWPQETDNFLSGTKNNVAFTVFDHTYYRESYRHRAHTPPTIYLRGVMIRHPDIAFPEFIIAPKQPDTGFAADLGHFLSRTPGHGDWPLYSLRSPEAQYWPPNFDQVLQKLESTGVVMAAGNATYHCLLFSRDDSRIPQAEELNSLIDQTIATTSTMLTEMRRICNK